MAQLILYFIIGGYEVADNVYLYNLPLWDGSETPRQQAITLTCWNLCVLPSIPLPPVQSAFKPDFHHLHISCIFKVRKKCGIYPYCICAPVGVVQPPFCCFCCLILAATACRVTYKLSWFKLVRLHFQCVRTAAAILLILALTVNAISAVRNL